MGWPGGVTISMNVGDDQGGRLLHPSFSRQEESNSGWHALERSDLGNDRMMLREMFCWHNLSSVFGRFWWSKTCVVILVRSESDHYNYSFQGSLNLFLCLIIKSSLLVFICIYNIDWRVYFGHSIWECKSHTYSSQLKSPFGFILALSLSSILYQNPPLYQREILMCFVLGDLWKRDWNSSSFSMWSEPLGQCFKKLVM